MARTSAYGPRRPYVRTSGTALDERNFYNLAGLDLYSPDELMKDNMSPFARNFRIFDDDELESRVAISKRPGHIKYTETVGEASNVAQTSTTGADEYDVTAQMVFAQKFTASATNRLSRIELNAKNINNGTGPIIVTIHADSSGAPGAILATSSIDQSLLNGSFDYIDVLFQEAPMLDISTDYWYKVSMQSEGTGSYTFSTTTAASTALTSTNGGNTWTSQSFAFNFTVYTAPGGGVLASHRFYRTNASPETIFVAYNSSGVGLYKVTDGTGAITQITGSLSTSATNYEFVDVDNTCYFVNGVDTPKKYTGGASFTDMGGSPGVAISIRLHKAVLFLLDSANRVIYSNLDDLETFESTSFIYIPAPFTADYVQYMETFQDNLVFMTKNTKWILYGQDVNTFTLRESTSTKGVAGQKAAYKYESFIYFVSPDGEVYSFNGGTDKAIGINISRQLDNTADLKDIRMLVHDDLLRIYYAPSGRAQLQNCLIDDLSFYQWTHDTEIYVNGGEVFTSQADRDILIHNSSRVSRLMYAETGTSDLGKPILFDYWTKYHDFGHPSRKHRLKRLYPLVRTGAGPYYLHVDVDADEANSPEENLVYLGSSAATWGGGETWGGGAVWGANGGPIQPRLVVGGQAKKHQIRFTQHGVDNPVSIVGYSTYTQIRRPI